MNKTVFVLTADPPETGGGVEYFVRELVRGLDTRGYFTRVFHRGNSEPRWFARRSGRLGTKLAGTLSGYWIGRTARKYINENVCAVISNSNAALYPLRYRTPLRQIHFYHGTYRGQAEAIRPFIKYTGYLYLKWWNSMVLERLSGRSKLVLCNSDQTRDQVRRFFGFDSTTVWLPIDTERFSPGDATAGKVAFDLPMERPIGLFVGSAHPMKGFRVVQALLDRLPQVHWVLALRGGVPETVVKRPNVTALADVPHDEIALLYRAADFSICPSLYEPFGYVVAEALACGAPVIATCGGASCALLKEPPLDQLLIRDATSTDKFAAAAHEVLRAPEYFRQKVRELAWPKLVEMMSSGNWWQRFFEVTGL